MVSLEAGVELFGRNLKMIEERENVTEERLGKRPPR